MFQKPANTYQGMVGALALAESDFIDLSTFMKNKKYDNMDEEQKKKMIKNTLEEARRCLGRRLKPTPSPSSGSIVSKGNN
jgi:hypothetical protein